MNEEGGGPPMCADGLKDAPKDTKFPVNSQQNI